MERIGGIYPVSLGSIQDLEINKLPLKANATLLSKILSRQRMVCRSANRSLSSSLPLPRTSQEHCFGVLSTHLSINDCCPHLNQWSRNTKSKVFWGTSNYISLARKQADPGSYLLSQTDPPALVSHASGRCKRPFHLYSLLSLHRLMLCNAERIGQSHTRDCGQRLRIPNICK
jgi:hypothetical protein